MEKKPKPGFTDVYQGVKKEQMTITLKDKDGKITTIKR
jgi:hypothetical protein